MTIPKPTVTILFLLLIAAVSLSPRTHFAAASGDSDALRAFKAAITPSSIPATSCLATWNFSAADPCAVPRVTHFTCAVTCAGGRVVQLTLDSQGYNGTLTPLISNLTGLIDLDLGTNSFCGVIPATISSLPNLRTLILRENSFSGVVPPSIGGLRSLVTLDLSSNSLSGGLPDMTRLVMLTRLDLSYNKLDGTIQRLPPNLNELALKSNSLSGSLEQAAFAGLTRIMVIELSENSLAGVLEAWFFLLPSLQQVDLARNNFTAIAVTKPPESPLVAVNLSYNQIEGFLPENFSEYPALRSLSLSYNRFRGPIPLQYARKGSSLRRLYLDGNFLNGTPPEGLFSGKGLDHVSLGDNCLQRCPKKSGLCLTSQKPASICRQAYGGKPVLGLP